MKRPKRNGKPMTNSDRASSRQTIGKLIQAKQWWSKNGVWLPSLVSAILLLAAFPPLNIFPLAWLAPAGWLVVCLRPQPVGKFGYFQLWVSGCVFWLVTLHSIRLAFWVLYAGWVALSLYLAIYIPLMVGATRILVHRWRISLVLAAPIVWTGWELFRSYMLSGYAANTLAHSQAWRPVLIQVADLAGHGGLSFLMVMFCAVVTQLIWQWHNRPSPEMEFMNASMDTVAKGIQLNKSMLLGLLIAIPVFVIGYGKWRLAQADELYQTRPSLFRALLLQENNPSIFEMNPNYAESRERVIRAWHAYANLSRQAARENQPLDLVVWPESTFTSVAPLVDVNYSATDLPVWLSSELKQQDISQMQFEDFMVQREQSFSQNLLVALLASRGLEAYEQLPQTPGPSLLVGCDHLDYSTQRLKQHAGAVLVDSAGKLQERYYKMHLVMFGEYIPLKPLLGWLENVFGFSGSDPGESPVVMNIGEVQVAPNICFETMIPRLILWQMKTLRQAGKKPQVLVNLTNDSWFKGTSMLDHHLASSVLCCVENRLPMLVAANTGLTAQIDGGGRLLQCSKRLTAEALLAEPKADSRTSPVQLWGYCWSWICAAITLTVLVGAAFSKRP